MQVMPTGWLGIYEEEKAFDKLFSFGDSFVSYADFKAGIEPPEQAVIDACKRAMPFDDGWDFFYAVEKCFGTQISPGPQQIGNCVGFSDCLSAVDLQCHECYVKGEPENAFVPYVPFSYGAGRVYIGGGRLGNGDGSLGSWQIDADVQYGYLPADLPGLEVDSSDPAEPRSEQVNRLWGRSREVLDKWKHLAAPHKIDHGVRITNADEAWESLTKLFRPLTIASNWGFKKKGFDSKYGLNIWTRSGSWAHQMHVRGGFEIKGSRFTRIGNQWGANYHGPSGEGFPLGGFVVTWDEFARWIKDAAVYARGGFQGRSSVFPGIL